MKNVTEVSLMLMQDEENQPVFIDPATVMTIIGIIVEIVKLYKACKKTPEQAKVSIDSPGFLDRWRLKRLVKAKMGDKTKETYAKILKNANRVSLEQVQQMYAEVD